MGMDGKKKMKTIKIRSKWKKLVMFDFDDTLAQTEEVTLVRDKENRQSCRSYTRTSRV